MKTNKKAMSLIELLIASLIMVIAFVALLSTYATNYKISRSNRMKMQAFSLMDSELEKMQTFNNCDDLINSLYYDEKKRKNPKDENDPMKITVSDTEYSIYYTMYGKDSKRKPYTFHRVMNSGNSYIKNDKFDASLIKLEINAKWKEQGREFHETIQTVTPLPIIGPK